MMTLHRTALIALIAITPVGFAMAQTTPPQDETSPSAASSPHQRDTTQSNTQEAPATTSSDPAAASTPHQRQATADSTADSTASHKKMMKDCIAKERANDSSLSKDQAKKACKEQMKQHSDSSMK